MNWRDKARKLSDVPPGPLTKLTKGSFVSSVSAPPGTFQSFQAEMTPGPSLSVGTITCASCRHFSPRPGEQPDGHCHRYRTETWSAVPFTCPGYEAANPTDRALKARQVKVEDELREHPELRVAFDVIDTPLNAGPGDPVSVVLAVRHGAQILSGELHIPRERFNAALFLRTLEASDKPS